VASSHALAVGYSAENGRILNPNGQPIQIRGISHFGLQGKTLQPQFLWAMGWKQQLAQIKSLGFNAVRVPISPATLYNRTPVSQLGYFNPNLNPEFVGKYALQVLDLWMAEANRLGLYVMLDVHSVSNQAAYPTWYLTNPAEFGLIYDRQAYTKDDWIRDLVFVAKRYANLSQFFAIDIYNEPNGPVRWSAGDPSSSDPKNFWKLAAESAAAAILAANPNLLIFVQGTVGNNDGRELKGIPINWGENFQPEAYEPLEIPADKLVLSPHTYGPDVYMKASFSAPNFPANLPANWDILFGQFYPDHPVVIGEWGGKYGTGTGGQKDVVWQNAFVDYMLSKGMRDSFYWCYTPNSGDTGGILDDQLNVRQDKMALLRKLWGSSTDPVSKAPQPPHTFQVR
jgi:aryl-phospho-beta-D-glucosidase BglC (GH1 family)